MNEMKPDDMRVIAAALGSNQARLVDQVLREAADERERLRNPRPLLDPAAMAALLSESKPPGLRPAYLLLDERRRAAEKARARSKEVSALAAAGKLVPPAPKAEPACRARGCSRRAARAGLACERCWHLIPGHVREALLRPAITRELQDIHDELRRNVVGAYLRPHR